METKSIVYDSPYGVNVRVENLAQFDAQQEFANYVLYEELLEGETRSCELFQHTGRTYRWQRHCVRDDTERRVFVVAQEVLPVKEKRQLAEHCQCGVCLTPWYNPFKLFMIPKYYGCLRTGRNSQYVINKTRAYVEEMNADRFAPEE